ncbi:hypothetical protein AAMO2058_001680300 [Amorphochlora amoebiformis]
MIEAIPLDLLGIDHMVNYTLPITHTRRDFKHKDIVVLTDDPPRESIHQVLKSRRNFHTRILKFELDEEDMERIRQASSRGNDLQKAMGDCGDEYRVFETPDQKLKREDGVYGGYV